MTIAERVAIFNELVLLVFCPGFLGAMMLASSPELGITYGIMGAMFLGVSAMMAYGVRRLYRRG